jgi:hypothetical protein
VSDVCTTRRWHFSAPVAGWTPTGVPVIEATFAILCTDCLGDWCESCGFTGMSRPVEPGAEVVQLPPLVAAVEAWSADVLERRQGEAA